MSVLPEILNERQHFNPVSFVRGFLFKLGYFVYWLNLRTEARSDIFEYIEMFYNSKRRHGSNGQRSPLDYEKANQKMVMCV